MPDELELPTAPPPAEPVEQAPPVSSIPPPPAPPPPPPPTDTAPLPSGPPAPPTPPQSLPSEPPPAQTSPPVQAPDFSVPSSAPSYPAPPPAGEQRQQAELTADERIKQLEGTVAQLMAQQRPSIVGLPARSDIEPVMRALSERSSWDDAQDVDQKREMLSGLDDTVKARLLRSSALSAEYKMHLLSELPLEERVRLLEESLLTHTAVYSVA